MIAPDTETIAFALHLACEAGLLFAFILRRRDHSMDRLPESPVFQRWQAHMADILIATDGQLRLPLEPMFTLDIAPG